MNPEIDSGGFKFWRVLSFLVCLLIIIIGIYVYAKFGFKGLDILTLIFFFILSSFFIYCVLRLVIIMIKARKLENR